MLNFHPYKCVTLQLNRREEELNHRFGNILNFPTLKNVQVEKDIGIHVDYKLEFDIHTSDQINKSNNILNLIRRYFQYLNKEKFLPLYKALLIPHLEQENTVWSPLKLKYIDAIEHVQQRATSMLPSLRVLTYPERWELK